MVEKREFVCIEEGCGGDKYDWYQKVVEHKLYWYGGGGYAKYDSGKLFEAY